MIPKDKDTIAVWFSCGAASAVAAKKTLEQYGSRCNVRVLNTPILEEDSDNRRFLKDIEKWLGVSIEIVINSKFPSSSAVEVWNKSKYMSGPYGAPCTLRLKKEARYEWERNNVVNWHVLGFTSDEVHRHKRFVLTERDNVLPVLIDNNISKKDCYNIINNAGISLPIIYSLGYPNANCIGCVKSSSVTYWNHVRKVHPDVFKSRAEQSRSIGTKLIKYKGKRIYLDELDETVKGRPMKNMDFECGIFCEEKP